MKFKVLSMMLAVLLLAAGAAVAGDPKGHVLPGDLPRARLKCGPAYNNCFCPDGQDGICYRMEK